MLAALGAILGGVSLLFGGLVLVVTRRLHRYLELPIIAALYLGGNPYAILGLLAARLLLLGYLFCPRSPYMLTLWAESANYLVLLSCLWG
jgi:hypothetical protein